MIHISDAVAEQTHGEVLVDPVATSTKKLVNVVWMFSRITLWFKADSEIQNGLEIKVETYC